MSAHAFKFIDLFAGIGGFHFALKSLGGTCVMACEIDPTCRKVYREVFPNVTDFLEDIRSITGSDQGSVVDNIIDQQVPNHDILCAGFPCQPFSKSGTQKGVLDRTRGTLFFDILEIIRVKRPPYLFLENVRNLAGPRHRETWETIIKSLRYLGYYVLDEPLIVSPHTIPPEYGGTPQVRERIFILGVRHDLDYRCIFRCYEMAQRLRKYQWWSPDNWSISDYLDGDEEIPCLERYLVNEPEKTYLEAWEWFVRNIPEDVLPGFPIWVFAFAKKPELNNSMPNWERDFRIKNSFFYHKYADVIEDWLMMRFGSASLTVREFPLSRQKFEWQARKAHPIRSGRTLKNLVIQFRPSGIRVKPPTYLPALVAITQTSVIGPLLRPKASEFRRLTPKEAARLQGIPGNIFERSGIDDETAYRQLGNAVNVGAVRLIASVLLGFDSGILDLVGRQRQLTLFEF